MAKISPLFIEYPQLPILRRQNLGSKILVRSPALCPKTSHSLNHLLLFNFLLSLMDLPVIDLAPYLTASSELASGSPIDFSPQLTSLCEEVSRTLKETGALLVKDPRCPAEDNDRFIDMMERFFQKPTEFKRLHARPNLHYQVKLQFDLSMNEMLFDHWQNVGRSEARFSVLLRSVISCLCFGFFSNHLRWVFFPLQFSADSLIGVEYFFSVSVSRNFILF